MSSTAVQAAIDEYLARQYGVITKWQARRAGMTDRMIEYRLETGRWLLLASGVWRDAH